MAKLTQDVTVSGQRSWRVYEPVIGLEVHAQLKTATKASVRARRASAIAEHEYLSVCLGLPGALPV